MSLVRCVRGSNEAWDDHGRPQHDLLRASVVTLNRRPPQTMNMGAARGDAFGARSFTKAKAATSWRGGAPRRREGSRCACVRPKAEALCCPKINVPRKLLLRRPRWAKWPDLLDLADFGPGSAEVGQLLADSHTLPAHADADALSKLSEGPSASARPSRTAVDSAEPQRKRDWAFDTSSEDREAAQPSADEPQGAPSTMGSGARLRRAWAPATPCPTVSNRDSHVGARTSELDDIPFVWLRLRPPSRGSGSRPEPADQVGTSNIGRTRSRSNGTSPDPDV